MSTSRPSTCRWSERAVSASALALVLCLVATVLPGAEPAELPPFLKVFKDQAEPAIVTSDVAFPSAVGPVRGYLARPDTPERLPAVLLVHGEAGLSDWMRTAARDLSGIGYVVLAPDLGRERQGAAEQERILAELSAAVRWLRRRADVLPRQVGAVGWSRGGTQALTLAANVPLQACVLCDGEVRDDPALPAGLRDTPVLALFAGGQAQALAAFHKALAGAEVAPRVRVYEGVRKGFMEAAGQGEAAEEAWVEVYEFLGKHVEDAAERSPVGPPASEAVATVADLMRAVNAPTGVRGTLLRLLAQEPQTRQEWEQARANAAVMAEAGRLLQTRRPPRGGPEHWLAQARAFTAGAEHVAAAADRADYAAARLGLQELAASCAVCHKRHR